MKAREIVLAAIRPRLPFEGERPSLSSATECLNSQQSTTVGRVSRFGGGGFRVHVRLIYARGDSPI